VGPLIWGGGHPLQELGQHLPPLLVSQAAPRPAGHHRLLGGDEPVQGGLNPGHLQLPQGVEGHPPAPEALRVVATLDPLQEPPEGLLFPTRGHPPLGQARQPVLLKGFGP